MGSKGRQRSIKVETECVVLTQHEMVVFQQVAGI